MATDDPLIVIDAWKQPAGLRNAWRGCAAWLCGGGPSLNAVPREYWTQRGVASLGINNTAAHVQTKAFVCSDPPNKFHWGLFTDPAVLKFLPEPKRGRKRGKLRIKQGERFEWAPFRTEHCPATYWFKRDCEFRADDFLTRDSACWGRNKAAAAKDGGQRFMCTLLLGLRLLHYLGVRCVFLAGVDFRMTTTAGYAFGQGRDANAVRANNNLYRSANDHLCQLAPVFERAGFHCFNTFRQSGLAAFPYMPVEEAMEMGRNGVPAGPLDLGGWYETSGKVGDEAAALLDQRAAASEALGSGRADQKNLGHHDPAPAAAQTAR